MLGKLFKRKSVPKNDGEREESEVPAVEVKKFNYVKVVGLELSNMEDSPVYTLKTQLSVGSEIGDIIISDPSVSPRHATFILQQDVASVIDHGSVAGTHINGKKIPVGKYIILEESDVISVGDLEIRLRVTTESRPVHETSEEEESEEVEEEVIEEVEELEDDEIPEIPELPDLPEEELEEEPEIDIEEDMEEEVLDDGEEEENSSELEEEQPPVLGPAMSSSSAANSVVRLVAVVSDLLIAYSLLVILSPFDEFRSFLESIQETLNGLFAIDWEMLSATLKEENGFLGTLLTDIYDFLSATFNVAPLLLMFILVRFISTLILGVSPAELFLSVRSKGNVIWTRVGGALRVLIGAVTAPFLIFDAPAIISRRTLKEVVTFTHLYTSSRMMAIIGSFILIPVALMFALFSPLFEGFEPPTPIGINDRIDQRVKVKASEASAEDNQQIMVSEMSSVLGFKLDYNSSDLSIIPSFKFQGVKSKVTVRSGLVFYQKDTQRHVELEVFKKFDLRQLLGMGLKGNIPLHDKYPQIYNFVYESPDSNPAFKKADDQASYTAFSNEFIEFTKTAFSLNLDNALDVMQSETFLIKGLIDYKASFLSLIEYKDFDDIKFIKVGNAFVMRISYQKQKPFELLIPLIKGEGRIYKLSLNRRENAETVLNKFFKYNLDKTDWFALDSETNSDMMSALEVYDFFSSPNLKKELNNETEAQRLYAYYFETSTSLLRKADPVELEIWKTKARSLLKLIEEVSPELPEGDNSLNVVNKLEQNFSDLVDAIENNNMEYFGIEETSII